MTWHRQIAYRLQALFNRGRHDADQSEEIRLHLEMQTEANIARGMSPEEAQHAARREFGGEVKAQEACRDERSFVWLEQFIQDMRFAIRSLRKSPGFTAVAVLSLAVAISVNTTVFSLINGFILRPLIPLRPAEVVNLYTGQRAEGFRSFSHAEYLTLRDAKDTFTDVAATYPTWAGIGDDKGTHSCLAFFTSENYFSMLGVKPALGRFYNADECRPNANVPVIVASYAFWQRNGGRSEFVGSTLKINGKTYTVIGIAAEGFSGLNVLMATDLWVPLGLFSQFGGAAFGNSLQDLSLQRNYTLFLTTRLAPGVSVETLKPRLSSLAQRLTAMLPAGSASPRTLEAEPPSRQNVGHIPTGSDPTGYLAAALLSISGCVLLIASLNLANLLLARGADRMKEIALRLALGATRWRIIRQLITEGLLLSWIGGMLGFFLSLLANNLLIRSFAAFWSSMHFSLAVNLRPNALVLGVTFIFCILATLLFSLFPAIKISRVDLVHDLQQQGGQSTGTNRIDRFFAPRHLLVVVQIALSLAVLFSTGLFFRGALKASGLALGFDPVNCLVAELDYSLRSTSPKEEKRSLYSAIECIREQSGVRFVAATTLLPYGNINLPRSMQPSPEGGRNAAATVSSASYSAVTSGYFDALGVRILRGRDFTEAEARDSSSTPVAIVDDTLARRLFPNGDAIGHYIREAGWPRYSRRFGDALPIEFEIVGICAPHRHNMKQQDLDCVYIPYALASGSNGGPYKGSIFLLNRFAMNDAAATAASIGTLRTTLLSFDPDLPVLQISPFATLIGKHSPLWLARIGAIFFGIFGMIALLLAIIGVYGVKAYTVARRTREIGIRMAIGAQPRDVFLLIIRQGLIQTTVALITGAFLALVAGETLSSYIYEISPSDPIALAGAAALLGLSALLAAWLPARRAAAIDPMVALRCE